MSNAERPWRVDSGMKASLSGAYRTQRKQTFESAKVDASSIAEPVNIYGFEDLRLFAFHYCNQFVATNSPLSLIVVAIDELQSFAQHYGPFATESAINFIKNTVVHHTHLIFGEQSSVVIGQYVEERLIILLPEIPGSVADEFTEYLRNAVVNTTFEWNFRALHLTISAGIAHKPGHAGDQDYLIMQADNACDRAMSTGGNRIAIAPISQ